LAVQRQAGSRVSVCRLWVLVALVRVRNDGSRLGSGLRQLPRPSRLQG
jgi:hypothetical protein